MGRIWINVIGRDPKTNEEWTIWNSIVGAPEIQIIVRPEGEVSESGS